MNSDCKECQPFIDETERLFGPTIRKYGFEFSECEGMRQGRECQVMYRASIGNLLFVLQDGAPSCFLGVRTQSLPPLVLLGDRGDYNWYHVVTLTEIALGNLVYDMRVDKAIRKGKSTFLHGRVICLQSIAFNCFCYWSHLMLGGLLSKQMAL